LRRSAKITSGPKTAVHVAVSLVYVIGATLMLNAQLKREHPAVSGIDHIPVVVTNLEKAQADFRAMGFAIKPGRYHADGITNAHVKFPDGTEIELITASKAVDALTSEYLTKLKSSEGPVYFGLFAPDFSAVSARSDFLPIKTKAESGMFAFPPTSPLHPLFIGQRNKAANDKPEYFNHKNTAVRLSALWVRDSPELREELKGLGVSVTPIDLCGFEGAATGIRAELPEGNLFLMPSRVTVVAARIEVRRLDETERILRSNGVPIKSGGYCDKKSLWVPPCAAHGIWVEFIEEDLNGTRAGALE
jgi:Glyoxalase-like domain